MGKMICSGLLATKNDKNQYVVRDSVANHKYQLEKYNVGVYAINTDGMQIGIAEHLLSLKKRMSKLRLNKMQKTDYK